jgi:ubiquinone/menaquinone biosynthesis C-methylase UbiE
MSWYADHVFPHLMDWTMRTPRVRTERTAALLPASGHVLEIGFGTGLNLPCYPRAVTRLTALEPATLLESRVARRIANAAMPVELVRRGAETLPFENGRFDCVVSTFTLCTIADARAALCEIRRVLKPDGRFIFLEHGRSDDARTARWQDRLNPIQRVVGCGCNLNRRIDLLISAGGLGIRQLDRYLLQGVPRVGGELYRGVAVPADAA